MTAQSFNIQQIAKKTRVSIATISRALNPETQHKVAIHTVRKIEAVLDKYPYTPNRAARQLRKTVYKTIGVLFPHHAGILSSDYYSQILSGAADALLETDYNMKIILIKPGKSSRDHYDFKHGEGVDGLVITYWRSLFSQAEVFERMKIPCVIINNVEKDIQARFVAGDHFSGGKMAAEYLYSKGHRHIAVLAGKDPAPDAAARLEGFRSFLKKKNIPLKPESVFDVNFEADKAYLMTDRLLAAEPAFTAVFCLNDTQAQGVLRRLNDLSLPCPERLSVMGYDNDQSSAHSVPPLTTVKVPVYEMARMAVGNLIEQLKKESPRFYQPAYLPVSRVDRDSVAQIKIRKGDSP